MLYINSTVLIFIPPTDRNSLQIHLLFGEFVEFRPVLLNQRSHTSDSCITFLIFGKA